MALMTSIFVTTILLGLSSLYVPTFSNHKQDDIQFLSPYYIQANSLYNIHVKFMDANFSGTLQVTYGPCHRQSVNEHHQEVGTYHVEKESQPDILPWVTPSETKDSQCLFAWSGSVPIGRSRPLSVHESSSKYEDLAAMVNSSAAWFDARHHIRLDNNSATRASTAKNKSIAIIGAGMAGLMTSHLLTSVDVNNWHIFESSSRIGGRVRTSYFNNTSPDEYQYVEMGAMRIPLEIQYHDTDDPLPFGDRRSVSQLVQALNEKNAAHNPELNVKFIPFFDTSFSTPPKPHDQRQELRKRLEPTSSGDDMSRFSSRMYKAHKEAVKRGLSQWSEGGYLRYQLSKMPNIARSSLGSDESPVWESLYWNEFFATTSWQTIDHGVSSLPRAFTPHVINKTTLGCHVSGISHNETTDSISVSWREDPTQSYASSEDFDYAIVAAPFGRVRLWELPTFSPLLTQALAEFHFSQGCKVALHYKTRFWEHLPEPIFGGCKSLDEVPGIGDVCYPNYGQNMSGPGVILGSFIWGNLARSVAALSTEEHVALVQRGIVHLHGDIANEQYTGIYDRICWENEEHQAGGWAAPLPGQQELFLESFYRTEHKTIFIGEHTSYTHAWISSALDSALRGTVQLLLELGLIDEARYIVETWDAKWIKI